MILFPKILASKAQKSEDHSLSFEIFDIEKKKIAPLGVKFQAWVLGREFEIVVR